MQNWSEVAHSFQAGSANSQILLLPALKKVPQESRCRFVDSLLHHTEHPEKASSHGSVHEKKSKAVKTTKLPSNTYLFSVLYG